MERILNRQQTALELRADEGRRMTFVASDGSKDRHGTVLNPDGWHLENFNANGIIGYQHNVHYSSDPDNVIGKGRAYVKDGQLLVDVEFEPEGDNAIADKVVKKLRFGTLSAVSVGFRPIGRGSWGKGEESLDGENPTYYYAGQELLEVSVVNIPSNAHALKRSAADEAWEEELASLREVEPEVEEAPEEEPQVEPQQEDPKEDESRAAEAESLALELERSIALASAASQSLL